MTDCVKSVHTWSYSGQYFPAFGLNTVRYGVSLPIHSECGKMRTRITPNTDTFHVMATSACPSKMFDGIQNTPLLVIKIFCEVFVLNLITNVD